jgi:hypothetical protein
MKNESTTVKIDPSVKAKRWVDTTITLGDAWQVQPAYDLIKAQAETCGLEVNGISIEMKLDFFGHTTRRELETLSQKLALLGFYPEDVDISIRSSVEAIAEGESL